MPRRAVARRTRPKPRTRRKSRRRFRIGGIWPAVSTWKRLYRAFLQTPFPLQLVLVVMLVVVLAVSINWIYQVVRKPTELFFPVSGTLYKVPTETWEQYGSIFRKHSTAVITADFLAALAQVEGSGNPIVRTYWRWSWSAEPFEVYRPASSAVGMYQITDGTFKEAKRYCVHDHVVKEDGPWNDWRSCWFNSLYMRVVPSHAVEMTSAYLDRGVANILARHRIQGASLQQKQNLAALIHLCGVGAGNAYARRGLRFTPAQRCGDHDAQAYVGRVERMRKVFARLAAEG